MFLSDRGLRLSVAAAAIAVASFEQKASAAFVSYREVFGNTATSPIGNVGWQGHVTPTAIASAGVRTVCDAAGYLGPSGL